jgi:pyridoxine/pyridoxamine 5'-phosphate oxidase
MPSNFMERTGKIEDLDRSFDLEYWRSRPVSERFVAAWELVVQAYQIKGKDTRELRLQRTVEHFQQQGR